MELLRFDKEFNMKKYIYGMAFPKAEATRRAGYYAQDIMEHLIKVLVYHKSIFTRFVHFFFSPLKGRGRLLCPFIKSL